MSSAQTFVVPYDFSDHARSALYVAIDLARHLKADCHLVHVLQPHPYTAYGGMSVEIALPAPDMLEIRNVAAEALDKVAASIQSPPGRIVSHIVEEPNVSAGICQLAEKLGARLIVMGTHGRTGIAHVFLGSVAERTLRHAPCPVLTVPPPVDDAGKPSNSDDA